MLIVNGETIVKNREKFITGERFSKGEKCAITALNITYSVIITDISYSRADNDWMISADDIDETCDYCFYLSDIDDITKIDEEKIKAREGELTV